MFDQRAQTALTVVLALALSSITLGWVFVPPRIRHLWHHETSHDGDLHQTLFLDQILNATMGVCWTLPSSASFHEPWLTVCVS